MAQSAIFRAKTCTIETFSPIKTLQVAKLMTDTRDFCQQGNSFLSTPRKLYSHDVVDDIKSQACKIYFKLYTNRVPQVPNHKNRSRHWKQSVC